MVNEVVHDEMRVGRCCTNGADLFVLCAADWLAL